MATDSAAISSDAVDGAVQARLDALEADNRALRLLVQDLRQQLWGKRSERTMAVDPAQDPRLSFFAETALAVETDAAVISVPPLPTATAARPTGPKGPKPIPAHLPREVIVLPPPEVTARICPLSGVALTPAYVERLEVLARRKPDYYVQAYERTVYTSPAKCAPVYTAWPSTVWPRAHMHVSVVAHLATARYVDHVPYYRLEQQLKRVGVVLPRSTQGSLMQQLDTLVAPLVARLKQDVLTSDYLHLDATPIAVCDPARPRATREATVWAYRSRTGQLFFDYRASKSPQHPHGVLTTANYRGVLQTDGAAGLEAIGPPGQIVHLGCRAHARRYVFKAAEVGESGAAHYLALINRLFAIDRRALAHTLTPAQHAAWRVRYSQPLVTALFARAAQDTITTPPKTHLGKALQYLLKQRASLERCVTTPGARLDNNPVENAIRPLKLGQRNWLFVGHPDAGPRLANLFTLLENCRQEGLDPEAYLTAILPQIQDCKMPALGTLLPRAWKATLGPA